MKDKAELINAILKHKEYKTYLELGIGQHLWTISQIRCPSICSVDVVKVNDVFPSFIGTTDSFFEQNNKKFDAIYIDADHEENAVIKDFNNSIQCLNEDGIIFMHDVGPLTEESTSLFAHGTAYKAFIKIRNSNNYTAFAYEFEEDKDVIGIVKKKKNNNKLNVDVPADIDFYFYNKNKAEILNKKTFTEILDLI
jgi:hypothetical protein